MPVVPDEQDGTGAPYGARVAQAQESVYAPQDAVWPQGAPPEQAGYPQDAQGGPAGTWQPQDGYGTYDVYGAYDPYGTHDPYGAYDAPYGTPYAQDAQGDQGPQDAQGAHEAQDAPQAPGGAYPDPYGTGTADGTQSAKDGSAEPPETTPRPAYAEGTPQDPAEGAQDRTDGPGTTPDQGGWPGYGNPTAADSFPYRNQAEPTGVTDGNTQDHVGYAPSGSAPGTAHERTDAGLPRRGTAGSSGGSSPAGASDGQRYPDGHGAGDGGWEPADGPRAARTGGTTPSGLPRRTPRARSAETPAAPPAPGGPQVSRAPEDVGGRLTSLRRGILRGRSEGSDSNGRTPADPYHGSEGPDSTYDQER
jgi:hypothetical protein